MKFFQMFDMSLSSGDIRDQSRKLSEIAPKFGRFLALPNFCGRAFRKWYARYHPYLTSRRLEKFRENSPTSPEVIEAHTLIFKPNFKFSGLNFFGGPPSQLECALGSLDQSLARIKKVQGAAPPNGRNVVSRKIYRWVGQYEPIELFCLWTTVH